MKPVPGFLMHVAQGKELTGLIVFEGRRGWQSVEPESYYVVHMGGHKTVIVGGPYPTEERAFGDVSAITDTSGT